MEKEVLHQLYEHFLNSSGVSTDSRTIKPGQIFWALKGPNHNGHDYIEGALEKWAYLCVTDQDVSPEHENCCFRVPDTLMALQELASYHRSHLKIPIIAITGSNGKTTTKEILKNCLKHQSAFVSSGNLNNHIGVPFSILQIQKHHRFAILEMGDNHRGEIKALCKIARPTAGLITNIGKDHIGNYQSLDENAAAKCELFEYVLENNGKIFVNDDDDYLKPYGKYIDAYTFGSNGMLRGRVLEDDIEKLVVAIHQENWNQEVTIKTNLTGSFQLHNILAAAQIAIYLQIPMSEIISGMTTYQPDNMRSQVVHWENKVFILDCYNSNPSSLEVSLKSLAKYQDKSIAVVFGDMLELGSSEKDEHINAGNLINKLQPNTLICVGELSKITYESANVPNKYHFKSVDLVSQKQFLELIDNCEFIFLKGSRANQLEKLVQNLPIKQNTLT